MIHRKLGASGFDVGTMMVCGPTDEATAAAIVGRAIAIAGRSPPIALDIRVWRPTLLAKRV